MAIKINELVNLLLLSQNNRDIREKVNEYLKQPEIREFLISKNSEYDEFITKFMKIKTGFDTIFEILRVMDEKTESKKRTKI